VVGSVRATCAWESANPVTDESYTFHGIVPWRGIVDPRSSECCALPNGTVACVIGAQEGHGVPTTNGVAAILLRLTHVRLFEPGKASPWLDLVVSVGEAGPMVPRDDQRPEPLIVDGHVEVDDAGLRVVTAPDRCARPLPCEESGLVDSGLVDCAAYRQMASSWRAKLCAARGDYEWRGGRIVRRRLEVGRGLSN
jgi:hypothetical protein